MCSYGNGIFALVGIRRDFHRVEWRTWVGCNQLCKIFQVSPLSDQAELAFVLSVKRVVSEEGTGS